MLPNQQNSGLQCDPANAQFQMVNLNPQSPPYLPQQIAYPQLIPYVPVIVVALAQNIQSKAQGNCLRMYLFNQCAVNSFNNQTFGDMVNVALDVIMMQCMSNNLLPEAVIPTVCTSLVDMCCALNLDLFPALSGYIDQNAAAAARYKIAEMKQLSATVSNFKMRYAQQQQQAMGGNNFMNNNQGMNMMGGQPIMSNVGNFPMNGNTAAASMLSNNNPIMSTNLNNNGGGHRVYTSPVANTAVQPQMAQPMQQQMQAPMQVQQPAEPTEPPEIFWVPNSVYMYLPAYNPLHYTLELKLDENNNTVPVLKGRERTMFDYKQHCLGGVFGAIPRNYVPSEPTKVLQKLSTDVDTLNEAVKKSTADTSKKPSAFTSLINETIYSDVSLTGAWIATAMNRYNLPADQDPMVYRAYALIATPVIADQQYNDEVASITSGGTYTETQKRLKAAMDVIPLQIWKEIDRRLTEGLNFKLANALSLPGLTIDSFMEDFHELIVHIENKYGPTVASAVLKDESRHLAAMFPDTNLEVVKTSLEAAINLYVPETIAKLPPVTLFASTYSLTYLNCMASELELNFSSEVACFLSVEFTPEMHQLAKNLFAEATLSGINVDRHLLRTTDNYTLEFTKGALGQDFYLVSLVN